ncbi:hypothetical protein BC831DRAFT_446248 [Entophlyctis helioformis]|nr:hypothetical protein BC831DRAFT_446248 [Entophlyctis helioformis]
MITISRINSSRLFRAMHLLLPCSAYPLHPYLVSVVAWCLAIHFTLHCAPAVAGLYNFSRTFVSRSYASTVAKNMLSFSPARLGYRPVQLLVQKSWLTSTCAAAAASNCAVASTAAAVPPKPSKFKVSWSSLASETYVATSPDTNVQLSMMDIQLASASPITQKQADRALELALVYCPVHRCLSVPVLHSICIVDKQ